MPLGLLLDLIAIEQIKEEGFELVNKQEDDFWALLERE